MKRVLTLVFIIVFLVSCRKRGEPFTPENPPPDTLKGGLKFGDVFWTYNLGGEITSTPAVYNGKIVVSSLSGKLVSLDTLGNPLWEINLGSPIYSSPSISKSGKIFITTYDGRVYCFNEDGDSLWVFSVLSNITSSVAIGDNLLIFGAHNGYVYALDTLGNIKWQYLTGGPILSTPSISPNGLIFIPSTDNYLYGFDTIGNLVVWVNVGAYTTTSPIYDSSGNIYMSLSDGRVLKLSPTGTTLWSYTVGGTPSTPILDHNGLIITSNNGRVVKLDFNRNVLWEFRLGSINMSPVLSDSGFISFVGSDTLYVINTDGNLRFKSKTYYTSKSSPTIYKGYMYMGFDNGYFSSFLINSDLGRSAWPKFGKGLRNTHNYRDNGS